MTGCHSIEIQLLLQTGDVDNTLQYIYIYIILVLAIWRWSYSVECDIVNFKMHITSLRIPTVLTLFQSWACAYYKHELSCGRAMQCSTKRQKEASRAFRRIIKSYGVFRVDPFFWQIIYINIDLYCSNFHTFTHGFYFYILWLFTQFYHADVYQVKLFFLYSYPKWGP